MVSILSGLFGGLIATIVMTAFMMALGDDSPPPPAALWAKYVGDDGPESYMMQGMALHLLYGIVAGAVFAVAVTAIGLGVGVGSLVGSVLWGIVFAVVLLVVGVVFWLRVVLGMDADPGAMANFSVFHLVYGVVLGASVALVPL